MAPLAFNQPDARIAFDVVLGTFIVLEWRARVSSRLHANGSSKVDHGSLLVIFASVYVAVGAFLLAARAQGAAIPDVRWPLLCAGLVLMVAGIAIRQWAVFVLGRFFTVDVRVHDHQTVVERGPYRWVRHPAYTGLILTFVGIGLALENWAALALLIRRADRRPRDSHPLRGAGAARGPRRAVPRVRRKPAAALPRLVVRLTGVGRAARGTRRR
jgi:protein-S-isoprenylcysteine O-methyltransferase Ste14